MKWVLLLAFAVLVRGQEVDPDDEEQAKQWLELYNADAQVQFPVAVEASWVYNTNITEYNMNAMIESSAVLAVWIKEQYYMAMQWNWQNFSDEQTRREFSKITDIGIAVLPEEEFNECSTLRSNMETIYSTATVCDRPGDDDPTVCYPLDPDLTAIMENSTDWEELVWAWDGWRRETGSNMPNMYEDYVGYLNMAAEMNGYEDNGAYWRSWYEDPEFEAECARLWGEVKPLYEQLHAFVRRRLLERYPEYADQFPATGHIPSHILGNMWAQSWEAIEELVRPYPDKDGVDVTEEMQDQGYDAVKMFELSEEFFTSLGLIPMTDKFWVDSMIVKPDDGRSVVCHASAWDFYNQVDFRIKQCTEVTMSWLITTHHEMGHIEYFLQYAPLHVPFRDGANPGFHEAIGDVMSLSVSTPAHMEEIGLLPGYIPDPEVDLNFLMQQALAKLAFLPFGYLIDQWRWDIHSGKLLREDYNRGWWEYRCGIQGVSPPNQRTASQFDAGSKYHVPADTPYIRYFVSHILQFQFQQSLCEAANNTSPLFLCDIYRSQEAGKLIGDMMALGSSQHWTVALEAISGTTEMSALPLVEYFQPLLDWLEAENEGQPVGWEEACPADLMPK